MATSAEWQSITQLSAFVRPAGHFLMAAFKGYFDESGKENDPQFADSAVAVAGYVTTVDSWIEIEAKWRAVLSQFGTPYLHTKEFAHSEQGSPFETWKDDEQRREAFITSLARIVRDSDLFGVGAVIRLPDLRQFNRDVNLDLQAYPIGIYACLIELSKAFPDTRIETIWDKVDNHSKHVTIARSYADSDKYHIGCGAKIEIMPLEKCWSFRDFPGLQIADFAAYELLKSHRDKNDWHKYERPFLKPEECFKSQWEWAFNKARAEGKKSIVWPNERKSFLALLGGRNPRPMEGFTWYYRDLQTAHVKRGGVWSA